MELDPLTAAVARLRVAVAVASKLTGGRPFRLAAVPHAVRPRIVVGDALLLGVAGREEYRRLRPGLLEIYDDEVDLFGRVAWPGDDAAGPAPTVPAAVVVPSQAEQLDLFGALAASWAQKPNGAAKT